MSKLSRILLALAGVALGGMYVFPLWSIGLVAPQYPEGLGMLIRINTVAGVQPNDLDNINGLNHYIGMKVIRPDAIPELRIMPWIVGALIALALLGALWGKRQLAWAWLVGLTTFGILGLVDFWRWTYDYGHNLDAEHAIIKVPGMSYSPPIFGSKQLLNFTAVSYPAAGAWMAGVAALLGIAAIWFSRRGAPASPAKTKARHAAAPHRPTRHAHARS